jgi:MYXO-CTERM domain-containing protein
MMNKTIVMGLSLASLLGVALVPTAARAVTVECSNDDGECTVSNDNGDFVSCDCGDSGGGTTGGNVWDGLNEAQMLLVCEDELLLCSYDEATDTASTTVGDTTDTAGTTMTTSTAGDTTDAASDTTDAASDTTDTAGDTTDTAGDTSTSGDFETDGDTETGMSSSDSTGGDPGTTTGAPETGDPETATASASGGPNGDDGGELGDSEEDASGCGCQTQPREGAWAFALGFLGLAAGVRRRG